MKTRCLTSLGLNYIGSKWDEVYQNERLSLSAALIKISINKFFVCFFQSKI